MKMIPIQVILLTCSLLSLSESVLAQQDELPQLDMQSVEKEIEASYSKAHPEVQEYVRMTARTFGRSGMWYHQEAFVGLSVEKKEERVKYLSTLLEESEYGRHLCRGLAEAGSLKDEGLVSGLMKVAEYQKENSDYDCRPKWMAVAALARQESEVAVPLLISLVDHGNQNTRMWASAALVRKTGQDFKKDKHAWAKYWKDQGHDTIPEKYLQPWTPPESVVEE